MTLGNALAAASGREREAALVRALESLAEVQGEAGLPTLAPVTEGFFDRGVRGLRPLAALVQGSIADPGIRSLPLVGTPGQWSDSVDLPVDAEARIRAVRAHLTPS